ncbi:hypothetical protein ILYODFUR_013012 [Ilyodon furcidens]|uniref:Uncharacterized protein n=1 Tax=Ilyodon furcidens TaxID=33524 RepID=A0ABV0U7R9_9TELE
MRVTGFRGSAQQRSVSCTERLAAANGSQAPVRFVTGDAVQLQQPGGDCVLLGEGREQTTGKHSSCSVLSDGQALV